MESLTDSSTNSKNPIIFAKPPDSSSSGSSLASKFSATATGSPDSVTNIEIKSVLLCRCASITDIQLYYMCTHCTNVIRTNFIIYVIIVH